jgi:hypothetical protein
LALLVPALASSQQVLLVYDTTSACTPNLNTALTNAGMSVTMSTTDETAYNGTNPSPASFDAVVHLNGVSSAYGTDMPTSGQTALVSYVQNGGAFVAAEWNSYEYGLGRMQSMRDLILIDRSTGNNGARTITKVSGQETHPIGASLPNSYSFSGGYNVGDAHTFTSDPSTVLATDEDGNDAVVVREFGQGRVVNFHHGGNYDPSSYSTLCDANVLQLFVDAVDWASNGLRADGQTVTVDEDSSTGITLSGTDPNGGSLTFAISTQPSNGTLAGSGANQTYTPDADFNGTDTFKFTVNNGTETSAPATVTIDVNPVNDEPAADAQSVTTDEDVPVSFTLTGTDIDGDTLSFSVTQQPTKGTIAGTAPDLTYTPNPDFNGTDSFEIVANDGTVDSPPAMVSVTVNPVNDAPEAADQSLVTAEDVALDLTLSATDIDGDVLTFTVTAQPSNGTLTGTGADLTYTPNANFYGSDAFTFKANDSSAAADTATVSIEVTAVNDSPLFVAPTPDDQSTHTVVEGETLTFTLVANDVEADTITYSVSPLPGGATLDATTGAFAWAPAWDDAGAHQLTLEASDTQASDSRQISVVVSALDEDADELPDTWETQNGLDPTTPDSDGDTIVDLDEVGDDLDNPADTDGDGTLDALDEDSDDDGILDIDEAGDGDLATEPVDTDGDGTPDYRDLDSDDDTIDDVDDNCPLVENTDQMDSDQDGVGDVCSDSEDTDGDGVTNDQDNCREVVNIDQTDTDNDGVGDACDSDDDDNDDDEPGSRSGGSSDAGCACASVANDSPAPFGGLAGALIAGLFGLGLLWRRRWIG